MTIGGHSLNLLGSGGAVSPTGTGQVSGGGPGDKAPESSEGLVFYTTKMVKNSKIISFWAELSHPADPIAETLRKMSSHIGQS